MEKASKNIESLEKENSELKKEILRLQKILKNAGVEYKAFEMVKGEVKSAKSTKASERNFTKEQIYLFASLFRGRKDTYAKRFVSKSGKTGYSPVCSRIWREGCLKKIDVKAKCQSCKNRVKTPLTVRVVWEHLLGNKEDCTDVIGVYALREDETCCFLVFDFDYHDEEMGMNWKGESETEGVLWISEINALRDVCIKLGIQVLVERSRSGNGAHLWIFFAEPILAAKARRFGSALLTKGAELVNQKTFRTYDRMLPLQDKMPEGGFGNLIALPMQGQAVKKGNSVFVNENWEIIEDQWALLEKVNKVSTSYVDRKIEEWTMGGVLGTLAADMSGELNKEDGEKPWNKHRKVLINRKDIEGEMEITFSNQIYITTDNIAGPAQNKIRRLAAFSNPEFYKTQAMGYSTGKLSRIIYCGSEEDGYIGLPRGCEEKLKALLKDSEVPHTISDLRQRGQGIKIEFMGKLYSEQENAVKKMLLYNIGILGAATAFGKTVVGAYLVAELKVNALILVHNKEIMENWIDDLGKFLIIDEDLPEYTTKTGRIRKRKSIIGRFYAGHDSRTGIVDIAMISSLGKRDNINKMVKEYGLVIMDECHHGGAQTHEDVLCEINAMNIYGFTATPKRSDGKEQKVYMQFGPIRFRFTAKERAKLQGIAHYVRPRFTGLINTSGKAWNINEAYKAVVYNDLRNEQIISDIMECVKNGRTPLVLTKFRDHAKILFDKLHGEIDYIFLLQGGRSNKERTELRSKMQSVLKEETLVIIAIGQYIGEGFNYPRLDTMMITTPIAWQGNVEQYAGRLHRDYEGKEDVIIYDYVDSHIQILERMYHKRMRTYKKIGYKISLNFAEEKQKTSAIFDSITYSDIYKKDLQEANKEIIISSPELDGKKINKVQHMISDVQLRGINILVLTLPVEAYPESRRDIIIGLINTLTENGIVVKSIEKLHEHFTILDKFIVWYGSMNFLSKERDSDSLMRIENQEIAQELLELYFS